MMVVGLVLQGIAGSEHWPLDAAGDDTRLVEGAAITTAYSQDQMVAL